MPHRPSEPTRPHPEAGDPHPEAGDAAEAVRRFALSLPGAGEREHHGIPSFRVADRIFATLPTTGLLRVFVGEPAIQAAIAEYPDSCSELWWGRKLAGVQLDLARAPRRLVEDYLTEAWEAWASAGHRAARNAQP